MREMDGRSRDLSHLGAGLGALELLVPPLQPVLQLVQPEPEEGEGQEERASESDLSE